MRILMVCLGNICRSPIAEGVLRQMIKRHGLDWSVVSAGTESYHIGEAPHKSSQKICLAHGIDISAQRAQKFTKDSFKDFDKIYAMAADVYAEIKQIGGPGADMRKVDYFLNELTPGANQSVTDPWYGPDAGFAPVYDIIEKGCEAIISNHK